VNHNTLREQPVKTTQKPLESNKGEVTLRRGKKKEGGEKAKSLSKLGRAEHPLQVGRVEAWDLQGDGREGPKSKKTLLAAQKTRQRNLKQRQNRDLKKRGRKENPGKCRKDK